jgi:hypothetical protein
MLHYSKIPGSSAAPLGRCVAFEKLDGTNLHWCWLRPRSPLCEGTVGAARAPNGEFGWHAFGTRRDEFNLDVRGETAFAAAHPGLEAAAAVFRETLAAPLDAILRDHPNYAHFTAVKAFTEFVGPNSFAGAHVPNDPMRTVLFDVFAEGYGFVSPQQFVADFGHLPIPRVVYQGKLTGTFLEAVREGKYGVAEGVVCKGGPDRPAQRNTDVPAGAVESSEDVWMVKVKTYAYLERLKKAFGAKWEDYWE